MAREGESDAVVRRFALETIRQVTPKDYLSELAAVYYATCRTIRYTRDPAHTEFVAHPRVSLEQRAGDCDDQATFQAAVLEALKSLGKWISSIGNQGAFSVVGFNQTASPDPYSHVFLRVQHPTTGQWLVLDPVAGPHTSAMLARVKQHRSVNV